MHRCVFICKIFTHWAVKGLNTSMEIGKNEEKFVKKNEKIDFEHPYTYFLSKSTFGVLEMLLNLLAAYV